MRILMALMLMLVMQTNAHAQQKRKRLEPEKPVYSLNPKWLRVYLTEFDASAALISICGYPYRSCQRAEARLQALSKLCPSVFLGIIDRDIHYGVPSNLMDTKDPELIILQRVGERGRYISFNLQNPTPRQIASLICVESSWQSRYP